MTDEYQICYLRPGERHLVVRALRYLAKEQQNLISEAALKYKAQHPEVFADHKQHHEKVITAVDDLLERFRLGVWKLPQPAKGKKTP